MTSAIHLKSPDLQRRPAHGRRDAETAWSRRTQQASPRRPGTHRLLPTGRTSRRSPSGPDRGLHSHRDRRSASQLFIGSGHGGGVAVPAAPVGNGGGNQGDQAWNGGGEGTGSATCCASSPAAAIRPWLPPPCPRRRQPSLPFTATRYDGSFWDALQREERIGGRNPTLHRGRSTHRIPRAHPCPAYLGTPYTA